MTHKDDERFFSKAEGYDKMAKYLVPQYEFLQDETLKLLAISMDQKVVVVDLGAGTGILLDRVLSRYVNANCYWVDYSDDALSVAQRRLSKYGAKVKYVLSSLEEDWEGQIPETPDIILSMSAIHHLETDAKKDLYQRCYAKLGPGGWFVNIDEMKTVYSDAYMNSMRFWVKHVEGIEKEIPADYSEEYQIWKGRIDDWASRNIDNIAKPKIRGDDIHDSFLEQLEWLESIGFANVDVFMKYHLWSAIGGQKGTSKKA